MALSAVFHSGVLGVALIVIVAGRSFLPARFAAHHSLKVLIAIAVVVAYWGVSSAFERTVGKTEIEQRASEIATRVGVSLGVLFLLWTFVMPFGAVFLLR